MTDPEKGFSPFATWNEVLSHVEQGKPVFYRAPLDYRPRSVYCALGPSGQTVHVTPPLHDADPFTADAAHLSRFRRYSEDASG